MDQEHECAVRFWRKAGFSLNDRIVMKISFKRKQLIYAVSKTVDFL